ncbi:DUF4435 domain-containing protein [Pseudomonas sp. S37]|uniref:DUF4435 domain-containing protein n=1 Tax=Pseudomonas sp. S37 TaxID=2767449 RepID=UPI001912FD6C|nr:DUF4435 domain-containing protein [Pseudomonas sp. S37]MBK4996793.1 DUF4435 domain-containing protein [Pseudomonas sp. S37]
MSRVEMLIKSKTTESVKFFEFIRFLAAHRDATSIFFEGEDEKYYSIRLNSIAPHLKWHGINAEGKRNVLELRNMIRNHPEYHDSSCLFIVDADFDDNTNLIHHKDVYITPCYSVENLYTSESTLRRILRAEFKISEFGDDSDSFAKAIETYNDIQQEYHDSILYFNIWIRAYRKNEQVAKMDKLNINNVNFDQLVNISLRDVTKNYDDASISTLFPVNSEPDMPFIKDAVAHFSSCIPERDFRGKQQLEFFRIFLEKLKVDANSKTGRQVFKKKLKVVLNLTKANCLSELSSYADTPECLISFIRSASPQPSHAVAANS